MFLDITDRYNDGKKTIRLYLQGTKQTKRMKKTEDAVQPKLMFTGEEKEEILLYYTSKYKAQTLS